jgi:isopentenyl phosphate kinase
MNDTLLLIKLGGSIITDKSKPRTYQPASVEHIARVLADIRQDQPIDMILGTGAGSFGHFYAHEYGLRHGIKDVRQTYGLALAHNAVHTLNGLVADALTDQAIPAFTMSPSAILTSDAGAVTSSYLTALHALLASGLVPVLHGDGVADAEQGVTIFSTEKVLQICLDYFRPQYQNIMVIYLMGAAGVLDANGDTIAELQADYAVAELSGHAHDVTGGIAGKIASARIAATTADLVYLLDGTAPETIEDVLAGKATGTRVLAHRSD